MSTPNPPCLTPDQDGYRTPTIEDVEAFARQRPRFRQPQDESSYFPSAAALQSILQDRNKSIVGQDKKAGHVEEEIPKSLTWKQRLRHFTWSFFTLSMATGGIANVIYSIPFRFRGLYAIGCIFFLGNIIIFITIVALITARFLLYPDTLRSSFVHPSESLFVGASIVSFGTILMNISQYGVERTGEWLNTTVFVLFWLYCAIALFGSLGIYLIMWSTQSFTVAKMTPVWIFPIYPLLIIGPHAAVLSKSLRQSRALEVIVGGITLQGTGFMVSIMIYSAFIYRLMTQKLPQEPLRPGMFVSVGPAGFTITALINIGENLDRSFPPDFMGDGHMAAFILRVVANWWGVWLWGLACWFFLASVGAHFSAAKHGTMRFAMAWFSFVFPQTALITATLAVGKAFGSHVIQVVGTVMAGILVSVWIFVVVMMIRAIHFKYILWPQLGEDKDEGGFKRGSI